MSFCAKTAALNTGDKIPLLGVGSLQGDISNIIEASIIAGYRHIDSNSVFGNERKIGEGILRSNIPRNEIWITAKLWNTCHKKEDVPNALQQSLDDMDLEYLDLFLIHWPCAFRSGAENFPQDSNGTIAVEDVDFVETWKALEKLKREGKIRNIGLANFSKREVERILANSEIKPAVVQLEIHPHLAQVEYVSWLQSQGIHVTSYSPFGDLKNPTLLHEPVLKRIAMKSAKHERMLENSELITLSQDEIKELNGLDKGHRYNDHSIEFKYPLFQ